MTVKISDIHTLSDCDAVTAADIEACRKELGCTPSEFAEHLGWSARKYQRELDATEENGAAPRHVALSLVGLTKLVPTNTHVEEAAARPRPAAGERLFERNYSEVVDTECAKWKKRGASWTAEVTPDLIRELVKCASRGALITYRDLAGKIEDRGHRHLARLTTYGRPLDAAVKTLHKLDEITKKRIPLLTVIVVTQNGSPGEGFDNGLFPPHDPERYRELKQLTPGERLAKLQREVFQFAHWDEVLQVLGLEESD